MKRKKKKERSVEEVFPSRAGREAADAAIESLGADEPMSKYLDTWHAAYVAVAGKSPFIGKR